MDKKTLFTLSIITKILLFGAMTAGLVACFFGSSFMGTGTVLIKYFTIQSNLWIGIFDLILAFVGIKNISNGRYEFSTVPYILQLVFTVSITLTGCVFCFVLVPSMGSMGDEVMKAVLSWPQILLHVVVPFLAILDQLAFTMPLKFNYRRFDFIWTIVPPLYYTGFAIAGYNLHWDFGQGANYPYFFFNFGSPAGIFGFSKEMPYFMGSFYWILALALFVLAVGFCYAVLTNRHIRKTREKFI